MRIDQIHKNGKKSVIHSGKIFKSAPYGQSARGKKICKDLQYQLIQEVPICNML